MRAYLKQEIGDAVDAQTLQRFCEESPDMIEWLKDQGVRFRGGPVSSYKTSYPTDDFYLYYSGNEKAHPYSRHARPVPRGHRVVAPGMSPGKALFEHLCRSAKAKGVKFIPLARVHELIRDDGGRIRGVRYRAVAPDHPHARKHAVLTKLTGKIDTWLPGLVKGAVDRAEELWADAASDGEAYAGAVILAAGGFIHNREWMTEHAPDFMKISPLGTPGDDGTGIALGVEAGGRTDKMGNITAWRFLSPPSGFLEGLTVGRDGRRIANEDLYGATHGDVMMREFGGTGWAIYDARTWRKVKDQIREQTQLSGRNAIGICSNSYVSGLSIADCIFGGRRAGAHAAASMQSLSGRQDTRDQP